MTDIPVSSTANALDATLQKAARNNNSNCTGAVVPSDSELLTVLAPLRAANPTTGAAKLHARLLAFNPEWVGGVSEKRVRRVLGGAGLAAPTGAGSSSGTAKSGGDGGDARGSDTANRPAQNGHVAGGEAKARLPTSRLIDDLHIARWTDKAAVHDFGPGKGKGLVATKPIEQGEVVWREDAWALAPEWDIYDLITASLACAHCSTPFSQRNSTIAPLACPSAHSSSAPSSDPPPLLMHPCTARFCNRLCLQRATQAAGDVGPHTLLCPVLNPSSVPLLRYARGQNWMVLAAWAACVVRVLVDNERGDSMGGGKRGKGKNAVKTTGQESLSGREESVADAWRFLGALAVMDVGDRAKIPGLDVQVAPAMLRTAHQLLLQAFRDPPTAYEQKRLVRVLRTPLPDEIAREIFEYDFFARGIIKMAMNLEAHGGLYVLHSHLNHSCSPNISARHLDRNTCLSRLTLLATKAIAPGEELTVTYVAPLLRLKQRRRELLAWGFGECHCERCKEESQAEGEDENMRHGDEGKGKEGELPELEEELKEGLGLF